MHDAHLHLTHLKSFVFLVKGHNESGNRKMNCIERVSFLKFIKFSLN